MRNESILAMSCFMPLPSTAAPTSTRQSRRNRWCRLQRHVRAAKIIPRREQSEHCFVVLPFLGERIRQPCEATVLHPNRQIVSLNVRPFRVASRRTMSRVEVLMLMLA